MRFKNRSVFMTMLLLASAALVSRNYAGNTADPIIGRWTNSDTSRVLEFVKTDEGYKAIVVDAEYKPAVGKIQISRLKRESGTTYTDGLLHIIQKDKTASCSATIIDSVHMVIKVRRGLVSKTQVWTRVEPHESGERK